MVAATVFTQTTKFTYTFAALSASNGLGARVAIEVVGYGTTTVMLDLAAGNRILAEWLPVNYVPPSPQIPWVNGEDSGQGSFSRSA